MAHSQLQEGNKVTTRRNQSLDSILGKGKSDDKPEDKKDDTTPASASSSKAEDKKDSDLNEQVKPVTEEDVKKSIAKGEHEGPTPEEEENSDIAPGAGIIKEEDHEEEEVKVLDRRERALLDKGVLSRVHKMSPSGMTHLNTYSGGEERVAHGEVDVVVKPLQTELVNRERTIEDETGKSRLLHPDITRPYVPSEQGRVMSTSFEHVYAEPYDPEKDPNR